MIKKMKNVAKKAKFCVKIADFDFCYLQWYHTVFPVKRSTTERYETKSFVQDIRMMGNLCRSSYKNIRIGESNARTMPKMILFLLLWRFYFSCHFGGD